MVEQQSSLYWFGLFPPLLTQYKLTYKFGKLIYRHLNVGFEIRISVRAFTDETREIIKTTQCQSHVKGRWSRLREIVSVLYKNCYSNLKIFNNSLMFILIITYLFLSKLTDIMNDKGEGGNWFSLFLWYHVVFLMIWKFIFEVKSQGRNRVWTLSGN